MKILCADGLPEALFEPLRRAGHEVAIEPELDAQSLPSRLAGDDVEVLVVRSTKVTAQAFDSGHRLGMVVRAGAGTDNIDKDAASRRGIYVSNVPGQNAIAVAELAMGLLLAIDRHIALSTADLRAGLWNKRKYSEADGILGKTMAIVGLGDVGLALAERAVGFGMGVTAIKKPGRSPEALARIRSIGIRLVDDEDELLSTADVVSLHVPRAQDTVGMVNRAFLAKLQPGAILLNTARGDLVDAPALIEAMDERGLRAGFDVWPDEPSGGKGEWESPLASHPHVVGSHHIGASTTQAQNAIASGTVAVIDAYLRGRVSNCVNLIEEDLGEVVITVRHLDKVGVLAKIFETLRAAEVNVQQMENQVFSGSIAAVASMNLDAEPPQDTLDAIAGDDDVLAVSLAAPDAESMTGFFPFRGAHIHPDFVRRVPAPALDSLSPGQRGEYLQTHPDSYTLVTRAPGDGGPDDDREPSHLIETGAAHLGRLIEMGAFVEVESDAFFLYEIDHDGHRQLGIAGLVDVRGYLRGQVKRHEQVDTERAAHLALHFERVGAQSSAIAMGYRADGSVRDRLDQILDQLEPRVEFTSGDGAEQRVWVVDDVDDCAVISGAFESHDLYIMDGHHRAAATALFYASAPSAASERMLGLLLADDRLNIESFHRRVNVPQSVDFEDAAARITALLQLEPDEKMARSQPSADGRVGVWLGGRWWRGVLPEPETRDPVSIIDPVRLQRSVIGPILGIDPSAPDHHLSYFLESADRSVLAQSAGSHDILFVMRPVTVDQIFAVADAGLDMPPKSTYVTPKPRSGVLLRRYGSSPPG